MMSFGGGGRAAFVEVGLARALSRWWEWSGEEEGGSGDGEGRMGGGWSGQSGLQIVPGSSVCPRLQLCGLYTQQGKKGTSSDAVIV